MFRSKVRLMRAISAPRISFVFRREVRHPVETNAILSGTGATEADGPVLDALAEGFSRIHPRRSRGISEHQAIGRSEERRVGKV